MSFGLYRNGTKIRKIKGNPRASSNQKGLIVWSPTKQGVKTWVREWGTKKQKRRIL